MVSTTRWQRRFDSSCLATVAGKADTYDVNDVDQSDPDRVHRHGQRRRPSHTTCPYVDANNNPIGSTPTSSRPSAASTSPGSARTWPPPPAGARLHAGPRRTGLKQGIILETDGTPEHNNGQTGVGPLSNFTCDTVTAAANAVKAAGIELYIIGYGVTAADNGGSVPVCPDHTGRSVITQLASMATNSGDASRTTSCDANENTDNDHFFCTPAGGDLKNVLHAAAAALAGGTRLVQLYPTPIVELRSEPALGRDHDHDHRKYFTEAYAVTFGGVNAGSFQVIDDSHITVVVPPGTSARRSTSRSRHPVGHR